MPEELKRPRGRPRKSPVVLGYTHASPINPAVMFPPIDESIFNTLKVYIYPNFPENETGGIPRVVEAQRKWLPKYRIEIVDNEEQADVLVCHVTVPPAFVKRFPQKPLIVINHGLYWSEYEWDGDWHRKVNSDAIEAIRIADAVVTCSEWVAFSIKRHTSRAVSVIPHGIELDEWNPATEKKDFVLWNKTRPDPVCDPEPLNQVATLLPEVNFLTTFGKDAKNVVRTGKFGYQEAKALIQQAGVYLCTTRETFGIGTLEALASGVPVVGFRWGGQAEFLEHGKEAWLVPPGDINGLAEGIKWALANRRQISSHALQKASQYQWEEIVGRYAQLIRKTYEKKTKEAVRTSIIVTAYKLEQFLPECLESVARQSDTDWECIIVDDASPDECGKIAEAYAAKDSRFKVIHNEKNVYLAEARNIGIRAANGRYILPLDADDMLAPNAVQALADNLDQDRSIHVAYGNVKFVEEDGKTLTDYGEGFKPGYSSWPYQFSFENQMLQRNLLPYCSMYRREAWEQTGGYRRRCRTAEDADMWVRFSSYGFRPKMVTDEDTLIYRNREGSMSRTEGEVNWINWFVWAKNPKTTPAGAVTREQMPVSSFGPIVVSVIIPVGPGHEKLVTDAVDSVDYQTFRNFECIVINDTGKPLETELPTWVKVIDTQGSTGPAYARNVGIRASQGKLFLPLDADDYLQPEALMEMLNAHSIEGDVVYSDFYQTDMTGKKVTKHECDDYDPKLILGASRTVNGVKRTGMMHSVTALTPKAAWEQVGGYDESLPAWEDWDFQIALGNIGVCSRRVAMPLFFYRKHTGLRREENIANFDSSKAAILKKWGQFWEGGKELMACGSCSARRSVASPPPGNNMVRKASPPSEGAMLLRYNGSKQGAMPFRGASRTVYWFSSGDVKYVLQQDAQKFLADWPQDFSVVQQPVAESAVVAEPMLIS